MQAGDCVVFCFPDGDTVLTKAPVEDYHTLARLLGRENVIRRYGPVIARPADKKDHYVKRCVAVAGDTLCVRDGLVWLNGKQQEVWPGVQLSYAVTTTGHRFNPKVLDKLGLNLNELWYDATLPGYPMMPLTAEGLEQVRAMSNVLSVVPNIDRDPSTSLDGSLMIFPFTQDSGWTRDNFGPLWIPAKGATVALSEENLPLYARIIRDYEGGDIDEALSRGSYTFKQDYYFMMGDNRHNSLDSRYWGFVPEDHVVGRPALIWLSTDAGRKFPRNIRWGRFFKFL